MFSFNSKILQPKLKQSRRSPIPRIKPSGGAELAFDESCCKSKNALFCGKGSTRSCVCSHDIHRDAGVAHSQCWGWISSILIAMMNDMCLNMQALVANPSTSSAMDLEKMQSLEVGAAAAQFRLTSQRKIQGRGWCIISSLAILISAFHHSLYVQCLLAGGLVLISLSMIWSSYIYSILANPAIHLTR